MPINCAINPVASKALHPAPAMPAVNIHVSRRLRIRNNVTAASESPTKANEHASNCAPTRPDLGNMYIQEPAENSGAARLPITDILDHTIVRSSLSTKSAPTAIGHGHPLSDS